MPDGAGTQSAEHADRDIAMTIRSVMDAVSVGEIPAADTYGFRGVLTDGTGRPLYTDIEGAPGEWTVSVHPGGDVEITNDYLGDLASEDLKQYVLLATGLPESALVEDDSTDDGASWSIYDFGQGELTFLSLPAKTKSGQEGKMLKISIIANR